MIIDDYASLKLAVKSWVNREDFVDQIPIFIQFAENELARILRIIPMETAFTSTIADRVIPLPDGYIEMIELHINNASKTALQRQSVNWIGQFFSLSPISGPPQYFSEKVGNIIFAPVPDSDYEIGGTYYKKIPALSDTNPTNWFTDNFPEVLLYGALIQSYAFIRNDEKMPTWQKMYGDVIAQINQRFADEDTSGSFMFGRPDFIE